MYVKGLVFLNTIGHPIFYRKVVAIENNSHEEYYNKLDKILKMYYNGSTIVKTLHCDGKYKSMMDPVSDGMNITMAYSNPGNHVLQAVRNNCMVTDTVHITLHRTGYATIPRQIITKVVELCPSELKHFQPLEAFHHTADPRH